jgi:hypothetical protein
MAIPDDLIFRLLATAAVVDGEHQNAVWSGLVGPVLGNEAGMPMVIKHLPSHVALATELACGLAAQELRIPVPAPALVICDIADLNGFDGRRSGIELICFGSRMQFEDQMYRRQRNEDLAADEFIWSRICGTATGAKGAAWDELVANRDRHTENVLYDGESWWLLDHELALEPVSNLMKRFADAMVRQEIIDYRTSVNRLASQMIARRPANHGLADQPRSFLAGAKQLTLLADRVQTWSVNDERIDPVLQIAEVVIRSIALRIPALGLHLQARIGAKDSGALWT